MTEHTLDVMQLKYKCWHFLSTITTACCPEWWSY